MKCIIIDDEAPARILIREYIKKVPAIDLVGEFKSPLDAISFLQKEWVDLIFLDIQMPGLTGIEFLKSLSKKPEIILTTAYSEYALEGYELDIHDYLLKPIAFERFMKAVNKLLVNESGQSQRTDVYTPKDEHLFLRADGETHKVLMNSIIYIEGLREYVRYHLTSKKIIVLDSLIKIENKLPPEQFIRVHKSFIVNKKNVTSFSSHQIKIGEIIIPIGKSYREAVAQKLIL